MTVDVVINVVKIH